MRKLGFFLAILILGSITACAQNRGGQRDFDPEERAKAQTEELAELLDLSKDQEKKVLELNLEAGKQMAKMRDEMQGGGDREGMREKFRELRTEQNKKMEKVLDEAQWEKYQEYLEERRARRGQGRR